MNAIFGARGILLRKRRDQQKPNFEDSWPEGYRVPSFNSPVANENAAEWSPGYSRVSLEARRSQGRFGTAGQGLVVVDSPWLISRFSSELKHDLKRTTAKMAIELAEHHSSVVPMRLEPLVGEPNERGMYFSQSFPKLQQGRQQFTIKRRSLDGQIMTKDMLYPDSIDDKHEHDGDKNEDSDHEGKHTKGKKSKKGKKGKKGKGKGKKGGKKKKKKK